MSNYAEIQQINERKSVERRNKENRYIQTDSNPDQNDDA